MEELGEFTLENIADCTYGIIVFDTASDDGESIEMVHWVGYWQEPEFEDFEDLKKELAEDNQFGLVDIADRLGYVVCSGDKLRELLGNI